ncbi:MAG: DUF4407 domain-containing protein [Chitinophagaceae bacterium]|nr:DUF4407 domain-containing protein [Chitinophagaceae bacterium]
MSAEQQQGDTSLYTYDSFGEKTKPSDTRFLWWCAGAHQKLLKEYPSEHAKYSGLGGVILATFVLAAASAGYAMYTVFGNFWVAVGFAIIWGLIIFNFDRFLVSTMRKYGVSRKKQVWMAIPRIALALLIGLTIARPLEMKIFEKEIDTKVIENTHARIQLNDSLLQQEYTSLTQSATDERNRLSARKLAIEDTLHRLQQAYVSEADGTGGSMQRGIDNLTRLKQAAYQQALVQFTPELAALAGGIQSQDSILAHAKADMEEKRKAYEKTAAENVGFLERNKALSDLTREESSVFWASLLISLLIILIETGPIISKLIMPVGPYDIALAKEELTKMAASENEMRRDKETYYEKQKVFLAKQKEMSDMLVTKLSSLQEKNINEELDKWERGEWSPKDHRPSMDEVMRKIKEKYRLDEGSMM